MVSGDRKSRFWIGDELRLDKATGAATNLGSLGVPNVVGITSATADPEPSAFILVELVAIVAGFVSKRWAQHSHV